jgi:hypothetical protein
MQLEVLMVCAFLMAYSVLPDILPSEEVIFNAFLLDWKDVLMVLFLHSEKKDKFFEP